VPHFPEKYFRTPPELAALLRDIRVRDYYHTSHTFPIGRSDGRLMQDAAFLDESMDSDGTTRRHYAELSVFGQYFYRQTLDAVHAGYKLIRASELFCRVDEFRASARKFYAAIGYQGYVLLSASTLGANVTPLGRWSLEGVGALSSCPDESVGYEASFLMADWEGESRRPSLMALKTIAWRMDGISAMNSLIPTTRAREGVRHVLRVGASRITRDADAIRSGRGYREQTHGRWRVR
jgi:hypothetical protein